MTEHGLLNIIKDKYTAVLSHKLIGIYVHGSIAFGCFNRERSDIDFLVVVSSPLTQQEKESLIAVLLELNEYAPPKGFEMSVILGSVCKPFVYPTPYELHFSNAYLESYRADLAAQCGRMNGTDRDLAAHITVTREVGIPLCGKPIEEVFAAVPREAYTDSLIYDIENAAADISAEPIYFTLNLCRVLAYLTEGNVFSKRQGGEWGLTHLPRYAAPIRSALAAYNDGFVFDEYDALQEFAEDMLTMIKENLWKKTSAGI